MRRHRGSFVAAAVLALLLGAVLRAQPFSPEIQLAINQVITGVVPFTALRAVASSYVNWGTTQGTSGYGLRDNAGTIQVKNSGGAWANIVTGATLPTTASFITRVAEAALSNETAMSGLATGLVINTTATGTPTIYAGATCTSQFVRSLSASGAATCASVALTADVTGILPVASGGTGLALGTPGGVLYFNTTTTTVASSGALGANQIVLGGGTTAPTVVGSVGTTSTVLTGNAAGAPSFAQVNLTTTVTGILPGANGGTGNGFTAFTGPTTALKTFTLPDANATVLTSFAAVTAAQGGTGQTSYTIGDLLQATGAAALSKLAAVAVGNVLISGGVGTASSWGKVGLTTHVTGTLPVANGGTSFASYTAGDLLAATGALTLTKLAIGANGAYLRSSGAAVLWSTLILPNAGAQGEVPVVSAANTITQLAVGAAGQFLRSAGAGATVTWSTTIFPNAATQGNVLVASAANTYSNVAVGTAGQLLRSFGAGVTPAWSTTVFPNAATTGDIAYATGANTFGNLADVAVGQVLVSGGVGAVPVYSATPAVTSWSAVSSSTLQSAAGNVVQTLSTSTAGDDPTETVRQYATTTIDAAATTIATIAIPATTTTQFYCAVTARRTGGGAGTAEDGAGYVVQVAYKNVAGAATEIAAETLTVIGRDQVAWTTAVSPVGGNAVFTVTGAAGNNVSWHATCRSYAIGS